MGSFAPVSWTDNYPAGVMEIGDDGKIKLPDRVSQRTADDVALKRGLEIISTGSTHKLTPMKFAKPSSPKAQAAPASTTTSTTEGFTNYQQDGPNIDWPLFLIAVLLICAFFI